MKATLGLVLIFGVFVANVRSHCVGHPQESHNCHDAFDEGHGGDGCNENAANMWYYNNGVCEPLNYQGCGGNGNRFCSEDGCQSFCHNHP